MSIRIFSVRKCSERTFYLKNWCQLFSWSIKETNLSFQMCYWLLSSLQYRWHHTSFSQVFFSSFRSGKTSKKSHWYAAICDSYTFIFILTLECIRVWNSQVCIHKSLRWKSSKKFMLTLTFIKKIWANKMKFLIN